jgi:hypothetical protein
VPIVELPEPTTKSTVAFGAVLGVRVLSNGSILVNDGGRRQLHLFDSTLARGEIVRDSTPGSATSYGSRGHRLLKWLGDSSIVGDYQGGTLLILGPNGQVARAMAPLDPFMTISLSGGEGDVDDKGRLLYFTKPRADVSLGLGRIKVPDSSLLVRADFESRRIDTLARMKASGSTQLLGPSADGASRFYTEPVQLTDAWAQLTDGSIAIVRGHDYHVDWIAPDGSMRSAPKMPFDWKRYSDEEKQKLIDSIRDQANARYAQRLAEARPPATSDVEPPRGAGQRVAGRQPQGPPVRSEYVAPELKDIFDFHAPLRRGAVMPDLDGNVWILPTSTAQSKKGELVYDVTNAQGEFHRVRLPVGRSIAGFGKGGVVFLLNGDIKTGFYVEKTKLPARK